MRSVPSIGSVGSRVLLTASVVLLVALAFAGCMTSTHGTVAVYVRAEPTDEFIEVELTMTRVEVQEAGAGIGDGPGDGVDRGAGDGPGTDRRGFSTVSTSTKRVDLLQYQNADSRALLGTERLAEDTYSQIVIRLTEAKGVLRSDGSQVDFRLPRNEIQQWHTFEVEVEETTRIILTIDLEASITQDDEGYRFSPQVSDVRDVPRAQGGEGDVRDQGA